MSFSLNKKNTNSEYKNQEKILSTVRKYFVNKSQNKLKEILQKMIELLKRIIVQI